MEHISKQTLIKTDFADIITNRIQIRNVTPADLDIIYDFNSSDECLKYIVREPFTTEAQGREKLDNFLTTNENKTAYWMIFCLKETGEKIGYGGLFDISYEHNRAEIGYGILKKHWNKGYMSEIVPEIVNFGTNVLHLRKIYALILGGNGPSVKLLEKQGFKKEAHFKEHSLNNGIYWDETIYSRINY